MEEEDVADLRADEGKFLRPPVEDEAPDDAEGVSRTIFLLR